MRKRWNFFWNGRHGRKKGTEDKELGIWEKNKRHEWEIGIDKKIDKNGHKRHELKMKIDENIEKNGDERQWIRKVYMNKRLEVNEGNKRWMKLIMR